MILASGIKYDRGYSWLGILLPLGGILLNHFIYLAIGFLSTDAETKIRIESRISEEIDLKAREDKVDEIISEWVCIKTYISSDQQYEYINDKELLDNAKIKYFVKSAGITNIFVDPKMADAAADILGLVNESNGEG